MTKTQTWLARVGGLFFILFGILYGIGSFNPNEYVVTALVVFGSFAIWKSFGEQKPD